MRRLHEKGPGLPEEGIGLDPDPLLDLYLHLEQDPQHAHSPGLQHALCPQLAEGKLNYNPTATLGECITLCCALWDVVKAAGCLPFCLHLP